MFGYWSISEEELNDAKNVINKIDEKIAQIENLVRDIAIDCGQGDIERKKLKRLNISKKCIKYYYSL